uniref:Holin n=1 Tax=viral metagenome TaxID=1070528 RepID=A0A6M3JX21_9ZZZZ
MPTNTTLAIAIIGILSVIAIMAVSEADIISVLSYTVTAIAGLATGQALK